MLFYQAYEHTPQERSWPLRYNVSEAMNDVLVEYPEVEFEYSKGLWFDTVTGFGIAVIKV